MIHRNTRPGDHHLGKYNGLGGKIEPTEDVAAGMRREIAEEAGIDCTGMRLRGTISWPGFGKHGEDWLGFVFVIDSFEGTPHGGNHEGTLEWVDWTSWTRCRCGRATATSCRWCSTPTRARSTGLCRTRTGAWSVGPTAGCDPVNRGGANHSGECQSGLARSFGRLIPGQY